jgi:small subunit ribosomal protein S17
MKKADTTTQKAVVSQKRRFEGVVKSAKENKTVHVLVSTTKMHPKYRKQYVTTKMFAVHNEKGLAKAGDKVLFEECRPLSKTKRWTLVRVM